MKKNISVKQDGYKDCAVSCVLSIIRYYGGDISKDDLSNIINTTEKGTNALDIINGIKTIGFDGYGFHYTFEEIINEQIILPTVAHIKSKNLYHFVVIYQVNFKKQYLLIMDPAKSIVKIKFDDFKDNYLGTLLIIYPVNEIPKFKNKISFLSYIKDSLLLNKKILFNIINLSILIMVFSIVNNLYFKIAIDYLIEKKSLKLLLITSILFITLLLIKNIFVFARANLIIKVKEVLSKSIMFKTIRHLLRLPYHYFKNKTTGEIVSRVNDLDNLSDLIPNLFLNSFVDIFLIIISMFILYFINSTLFFISSISILIYLCIVLLYKNVFKKRILDIKENNAYFNSNLTETICGYESIKNLNLIDTFNKKLELSYILNLRSIRNLNKLFNTNMLLKNLINDLGIMIILSIGSYAVITNKMSIGDLITFYTLMMFFIGPIKEILDLYPSLEEALSSYERINELLKVKESEVEYLPQEIKGDIEIKNLSYSYNNLDQILKNINLNIKHKNFMLFYGTSGSGKSTLIKILSKYLNNYKGTIKIGGLNIKDINDSILKDNITVVSQNEFLFNDTLENNIKLNRNISNEKYEKILNITKVDKIRDKKKFRNHFIIEENGFNISGGERQKIVLARALLSKFNYLILDEALSEVGSDEEKEIITSIKEKYKNKTIIYVSHKKEIIDLFDMKYKFGEEYVC